MEQSSVTTHFSQAELTIYVYFDQWQRNGFEGGGPMVQA